MKTVTTITLNLWMFYLFFSFFLSST